MRVRDDSSLRAHSRTIALGAVLALAATVANGQTPAVSQLSEPSRGPISAAATPPMVLDRAASSAVDEPPVAEIPAKSEPASLEGIWQPDYSPPPVQSALGTNGAMSTIEGGLPPFTAEGANIFWHRVAMEQRGTPVANSAAQYLPGIPVTALGLFLGPMNITQNKDNVVILFEGGSLWHIRLNRGHPTKLTPTYRGDSVGHWEGATLVIDSTGFNTKTWLDSIGSPHSASLRFVTRVTRIRQGRQLEFLTTFDDPTMYSKPFTVRSTASWRPDLRMLEVEIENMRPENNANLVYED